MTASTLRHPLTGELLAPLGMFRGRPVWPILGGAEGEGGEGEGGDGEGEGGASSAGSGSPEDNLDQAVKDILAKERKAARDATRRASAAEAEAKKLRDAGKSDADKATDQAAEATKRAEAAEARALRLEVAADKKLPSLLAQRLVGSTKEELEADADALVKQFAGADGGGGSGGDPDQGRTDNGGRASTSDMNAWMRRAVGRST